jgi:hypothetical protein
VTTRQPRISKNAGRVWWLSQAGSKALQSSSLLRTIDGVTLHVDVMVDPATGERPPPGTPLTLELRDTSLADAPARVLARVETTVGEGSGDLLASVDVPDAGGTLKTPPTVWAHADVSGDGRVSVGDYITMQSHPAPSPELQPRRLTVTLRPVR